MERASRRHHALYARNAYPCDNACRNLSDGPQLGRGYAQQTIHPHDQADADRRINAATVKKKLTGDQTPLNARLYGRIQRTMRAIICCEATRPDHQRPVPRHDDSLPVPPLHTAFRVRRVRQCGEDARASGNNQRGYKLDRWRRVLSGHVRILRDKNGRRHKLPPPPTGVGLSLAYAARRRSQFHPRQLGRQDCGAITALGWAITCLLPRTCRTTEPVDQHPSSSCPP
jgi:hypothetical protein